MLQDRLVAHRGYQKKFPENTLLGLSKAIEAGAHYIETDILFSADGEPVLYHDITMQRISGCENAIHLLPLSELIQQPACEPERLGKSFTGQKISPLSALVELLQDHSGITAFIEVKRAGIQFVGTEQAYRKLLDILEPVISQCVLISFNDEFIQHAWRSGYSRLGLVLKDWDILNSGYIGEIAPEFIFCETEKVPPGMTLDQIESTLVIYEVADPDEAIDWFRRGADMVETFDIRGMIENLAHRAL